MDLLLPWRQNRNGNGVGGHPGHNHGANAPGRNADAGGMLNNIPFFDPQHFFRRDNRNRNANNNNGNNGMHAMGQDPVDQMQQYKHYQDDDPSSTSPLQRVLDELNMSILPHDIRLSAIIKASQLFDHRDRTKHDYELHEGAARILYQKIAFVLTLCLQSSSNPGIGYDAVSSYNMPTNNFGDGNNMSNSSEVHINGVHVNNNPSDDASAFTMGSGGAAAAANSDNQNNRPQIHRATSSNSVGSNANTSVVSMQRMRSTRSAQASDADYEIAILTACLEMVHRGSNGKSFNVHPLLLSQLHQPRANLFSRIHCTHMAQHWSRGFTDSSPIIGTTLL